MNIDLTASIGNNGTDWDKYQFVGGQSYQLTITNKDADGANIDMNDKPVAFLMRRSKHATVNAVVITAVEYIYQHETDNYKIIVSLPSNVTSLFSGRYYVEYGFLMENNKVYRTGYGEMVWDNSQVSTVLAEGYEPPALVQDPAQLDVYTTSEVNDLLSTHSSLDTGVHGVGESTVESVAGAQAKVDTHENKAAPHSGHETPAGAQGKVDTHAATVGNHTDVDLTGAAEGDFLQRESGVWVKRTRGEVVGDLLSQGRSEPINAVDFISTGTSGTGTAGTTGRIDLRTGTTAESTARASIGANSGYSVGVTYQRFNYAKPIIFIIYLSPVNSTSTNMKKWLLLGVPFTQAVGDPGVASLGFRIDDTAVKGLAHNGTSLTATDLGVNIHGTNTTKLTCVSYGDGDVEYYIDNVLKGSTVSGPSGLGTASAGSIYYATTNGIDTTSSWLWVFRTVVYAEE